MKTVRPAELASPKLASQGFAQLTGLAVTAIVVLGLDTDPMLAVALGTLAGAVATFFVSLSNARLAARKL